MFMVALVVLLRGQMALILLRQMVVLVGDMGVTMCQMMVVLHLVVT
jgi:hypothetical protein